MCLTARQIEQVDALLDRGDYEVSRGHEQLGNALRPAWNVAHQGRDPHLVIVDTDTKVRRFLHGALEVKPADDEMRRIAPRLGSGRFVSIEGLMFFEVADERSPVKGKLFRLVTPRPIPAETLSIIELDPETMAEMAREFGHAS